MFKMGNAAHFRRVFAGVSLLTAPMLFAAAEVLAPESDGSAAGQLASYAAHRGALLASAMLGLASTMFFLPAIVGLLHTIRSRGVTLVHIGAVMCLYGLVTAHAALNGINIMFYEMTSPNLDSSAMLKLLDDLYNAPAVGVPLLLGHFIFGFGIVLLGIAIWRSRVFPRWAGACVALWIVVDILVGFAPLDHVVGDLISNAFALAGFGILGWALLNTSDATWETGFPEQYPLTTEPAPTRA